MHVYLPPEPWPPAVRAFIETSRRECAEPIAYATDTARAAHTPPRPTRRELLQRHSMDRDAARGHFAALEEPELLLAGEMLMLAEATAAIRGRGREWAPRRR